MKSELKCGNHDRIILFNKSIQSIGLCCAFHFEGAPFFLAPDFLQDIREDHNEKCIWPICEIRMGHKNKKRMAIKK